VELEWNQLLKFRGPCTVYTQSRNPQDLRRLQEYAARKQYEEDQNQGNTGVNN